MNAMEPVDGVAYAQVVARAKPVKRSSPLDSRREQNIGIVLRALRLSTDEVQAALLEVRVPGVCVPRLRGGEPGQCPRQLRFYLKRYTYFFCCCLSKQGLVQNVLD